jgi:GNAT superfamily N-acetyltransferase
MALTWTLVNVLTAPSLARLPAPRYDPRMRETRELQLRDLDGLLRLYAELHPCDDPAPGRAQLEATWRSLVDNPDHIYLGAFEQGELVSACNACIVPNLTRAARPYALVENVVTHSAFRRQGYGASAMRALLDRCWARGCYKVMLMSAVQRSEIYGFYVALGFDPRRKQAFVLSARN